ncbi:MAG: ACT domain-containing protein [Anaerolineae bacterium]|jgi:hypothetical protein|nr:ACT domain-containing protein [Anaerolineae bacterium]MBT7190394.1 ACT domain-containing protein [Anaerolineae bacterium]MBT7989168.1 ACT domain-containing protein [Anaerolineae bacterium]
MNKLKLAVLSSEYTIHRFSQVQDIPANVLKSEFFSVSKTKDELSILCDTQIPVLSEKRETGWVCIKVLGPLDFGLTGILAKIATILAEVKISIFAISTYDTDYILVRKEKLSAAQKALAQAGYVFEN